MNNRAILTPSSAVPCTSVAEILFISSYPPRVCGIATYTQDLIKALHEKFTSSFKVRVCALESEGEHHDYGGEVDFVLNTDDANDFIELAQTINQDPLIKMVLVQHEFGLFDKRFYLEHFLKLVDKPIILVYHTVLPNPSEELKVNVQTMSHFSEMVIVMTHTSADILVQAYDLSRDHIKVIPHGTHLVPHLDKQELKEKYQMAGRQTLATFGLLSSGKSIETTLDSLPEILKSHPDVLFLIIGKTHPAVVKSEGEAYRHLLEEKVRTLGLQHHVQFVNHYLALPDLLEYLQLTDIYLFTSSNPHQAVSGTFAYALSCGCPIISTPIPHAREVLKNGEGLIVEFQNPKLLSAAVLNLFSDEKKLDKIRSKGIHRMAPTAWENAAIAHALVFESVGRGKLNMHYKLPPINLAHLKKMTTSMGIVQFAVINTPDLDSGYTLDDNARALVAVCQHYELTRDPEDLNLIRTYLEFIVFCWQKSGSFLNYMDQDHHFTSQNNETNLADSNGRAVWALGYLISLRGILPEPLVSMAEKTMDEVMPSLLAIHSTRAMAFCIKGLYYRSCTHLAPADVFILTELSNRLVQMYRHESTPEWSWFESYLTYGNSILPEALLCAWLVTGNPEYRAIAKSSFDFLLGKIFTPNRIRVISNQGWHHKGEEDRLVAKGGEQPIDVAYTILALRKFYLAFQDESYEVKSKLALDWFLGNNHLQQIIYNPCTGGCYDGLEETYINLNQGAESTVSYLMARLTLEKEVQRNRIDTAPHAVNHAFRYHQHLLFLGHLRFRRESNPECM